MSNNVLQRYLAFFSYVGSRYRGYQEQTYCLTPGKSIQETIESALYRIAKTPTKITSCSRTDAGVNAYRLPIHFTLSLAPHKEISHPDLLKKSMNFHLRYEDIRVEEIRKVPANFNVQRQCIEKEYVYRIEAGLGDSFWNPIQQHKLVYSVAPRLDTGLMREAINEFEGTHNFYHFTVRAREFKFQSRRFVRKINEIYLSEKTEGETGRQSIELGFKAKGFLTYQIRYMVNAIKDVGQGNYPVEAVREALKVREEVIEPEIGKRPAPAKGLFLKNVVFSEDIIEKMKIPKEEEENQE